MTEVLDCSPCYEGAPDIVPGAPSALPQESLARSRLFAGGTFFRSKYAVPGDSDFQGVICNSIALQVVAIGTDWDLIVFFQDVEVERYSTTQALNCSVMLPSSAISDLRTQTAASSYISMPPRGSDEQDEDVLMMPPTDDPCLSFFTKTNMTGGVGPGEADVTTIRTGPDRTIAFINTKENANGTPVSSRTLIQWNYDISQWVSYALDADCAIPENRCP